jgi:hypothetical protein
LIQWREALYARLSQGDGRSGSHGVSGGKFPFFAKKHQPKRKYVRFTPHVLAVKALTAKTAPHNHSTIPYNPSTIPYKPSTIPYKPSTLAAE